MVTNYLIISFIIVSTGLVIWVIKDSRAIDKLAKMFNTTSLELREKAKEDNDSGMVVKYKALKSKLRNNGTIRFVIFLLWFVSAILSFLIFGNK